MKISTKGRYALRVMIDLAEHSEKEYIAMKEVAERQGVSLKYLEKILPDLVKAGLIEGIHGKGGGYKLSSPVEKYSVGEIICACEGDIAPVACLDEGAAPCEKANECRTLPLWIELNDLISNFLFNKKLADLVKK